MLSRKNKTTIFYLCLLVFLFVSAFSSFLIDKSNADAGAWIYSAFDEVLGVDKFLTHNPLWPDSVVEEFSTAESWRCSTCHGWNYQGLHTYGNELIEFPGLGSVSEMTDDEISAWLEGSNNSDHDFSKYLTIESMAQLLSFFRDDRFLKWVDVNEIEVINAGNGTPGEDTYKKNCKECHGTQGAKINLGSISEPSFLGDLITMDQSRMIHLLEFGYISHDKLFDLDENLGDEDLINLTKYLRAMPISNTVLEEREVLQFREFDAQGETQPILIGAFSIFFLFVISRWKT